MIPLIAISTLASGAGDGRELDRYRSRRRGWVFILSKHVAFDGVKSPVSVEARKILGGDTEGIIQVFKLFAFGFRNETFHGVSTLCVRFVKDGKYTHKYMRTKPMMHQAEYHMKAPNGVKAVR